MAAMALNPANNQNGTFVLFDYENGRLGVCTYRTRRTKMAADYIRQEIYDPEKDPRNLLTLSCEIHRRKQILVKGYDLQQEIVNG